MPKLNDRPVRINIKISGIAHARFKAEAKERTRREGAFCSIGRIVSDLSDHLPSVAGEPLHKPIKGALKAAG